MVDRRTPPGVEGDRPPEPKRPEYSEEPVYRWNEKVTEPCRTPEQPGTRQGSEPPVYRWNEHVSDRQTSEQSVMRPHREGQTLEQPGRPVRPTSPDVMKLKSLADLPTDLYGRAIHVELPDHSLLTIDGRNADPALDHLHVKASDVPVFDVSGAGGAESPTVVGRIGHSEGFRVHVVRGPGLSVEVEPRSDVFVPEEPRTSDMSVLVPRETPVREGVVVEAGPEVRVEALVSGKTALELPSMPGEGPRQIVLAKAPGRTTESPGYAYQYRPGIGIGAPGRLEVVAIPGVTIACNGLPTTTEGPSSWSASPEVEVVRLDKGVEPPPQGVPFELEDYTKTAEYRAGADFAPDVVVKPWPGRTDIRHLASGTTVRVSLPLDKTGAAYAYDVQSRVLGATTITVVKTPDADVRLTGCTIGELPKDLDLRVYEVDGLDRVPTQGTRLTPDLLDSIGARSTSIPVEGDYSTGDTLRMAATDTVIGMIPVVGDLVDAAEFVYGVVKGQDRWGRPLGKRDLEIMGAAVVVGLVPGVSSRMVRGAAEAPDAIGTVRRMLSKAEVDDIARWEAAMREGREIPASEAARIESVVTKLERGMKRAEHPSNRSLVIARTSKLPGAADIPALRGLDYDRAHLWARQFGDEAAEGVMYAPKSFNTGRQEALESQLKEMRSGLRSDERLILRARATSYPRQSYGGALLKRAEYDFQIVTSSKQVRERVGLRFEVEPPTPGRIGIAHEPEVVPGGLPW